MTADRNRLSRIADEVLSAWNTQDVEAVLARYADDLLYLDPNTRGPVFGRDAMRAYLTKLFGRWTMTWAAGEIFPLETDGVAIRWTGTLALAGEEESVAIGGLDLVILEGDLVKRNEVYFDRAPVAALMASAAR
jgi:ketosteroid isomerase-like protein